MRASRLWRSVYNTLLLKRNLAREILVNTLRRPSLLLSYGLLQVCNSCMAFETSLAIGAVARAAMILLHREMCSCSPFSFGKASLPPASA
jgi:hypothetical protein